MPMHFGQSIGKIYQNLLNLSNHLKRILGAGSAGTLGNTWSRLNSRAGAIAGALAGFGPSPVQAQSEGGVPASQSKFSQGISNVFRGASGGIVPSAHDGFAVDSCSSKSGHVEACYFH
ncbi:MAG: hypothetical protein EPO55_17725 [Reyranella sp.]|uniref:hypothetical protein n=1 Tax=Reyranella sp. TaxID=1929291 RepID=UPI00122063F8|nr:hypothetical protein [Reyranella sp.]TAJ37800.1 MAG: hypothetical protein EPO55_17725 [Reyranella sp.]